MQLIFAKIYNTMDYLCIDGQKRVEFILQLNLKIFRTQSINYVNHNVAEEDPYDKGVVKTENMCFCQSLYSFS